MMGTELIEGEDDEFVKTKRRKRQKLKILWEM